MNEEIKDKIQKLILDSGYTAHDYVFKNDLASSNNSVGLSKWLSKEIEEIDECINNLEAKNGLKCVCKKGCAECCKQLIVVLSSEIIAYDSFIRKLDENTQNIIKKRTYEACELLEKHGISNHRVQGYISKSEEEKFQNEYFELDIPCIFLDSDNSCIVHAIRPSLCWSYREYYNADKCKQSCFSDTGLKFDDWEKVFTDRLIKIRKPHKGLMILPFAIKELMHW